MSTVVTKLGGNGARVLVSSGLLENQLTSSGELTSESLEPDPSPRLVAAPWARHHWGGSVSFQLATVDSWADLQAAELSQEV